GIGLKSVDAEVARLSGGQRQAIAIARAIYSDAKVLLLDEPLAAMGAKEAALILDLIRNIKNKGDVSVIVIAHNYAQGLEIADRGHRAAGGRDQVRQARGGAAGAGAERHRHRRVPPRPGGAQQERLTAQLYTGTNSMPVPWQNPRHDAAWWPRFITSWCGPP